MTSDRLKRRRFLSALGLGALSAWLTSGERSARAATATAAGAVTRPRCFVGVYTPHGMAHEHWRPGEGFNLRTPGSSLAPFDDAARFGRSFKQNLLLIDGLDLAAGIEVGTVGHDASRVLLTGSGAQGKNASLDQYLALEQKLGQSTPFTSLTLAVGSDGAGLGGNVSYANGGTPLPKQIDPGALFAELFGAPLGEAEQAALAARRQRQRSVLDALSGELKSLGARAPASERPKLEQHLGALREIEKRLDPPTLECALPERPDAARFPKLRAYGGGERYFDAISDLQVDLLARALACDLTRFATLMLADLSRTELYPSLPRDLHTDVAHLYAARSDKAAGKPETWAPLAVQNEYSYSKVARLAQRLAEAELLDQSLIYVSSDMGDPARHSSRNVPTLLVGGSATPFGFGRLIDLRTSKREGELVPHNRLLVSICQAFGVETERFGTAPKSATITGRLDALST
jgi:hypothetical protein